MQIGIVIAEVANFKVLHQSPNLLLAQKERWNSHKRGAVLRNRFREIELWQDFGTKQRRGQVVHDLHRALRRRQKQEDHGEENHPWGCVGAGQQQNDGRHDAKRKHFYSRQIKLVRMGCQEMADLPAECRTKTGSSVQFICPRPDQVIADVGLPLSFTRIIKGLLLSVACQGQRSLRYFHFSRVRALCDLDDAFAVKRPAVEIHQWIRARRVLTKNFVKDDLRVEYIFPVQLAHLSQAAHADTDFLRLLGTFQALASANCDLFEHYEL